MNWKKHFSLLADEWMAEYSCQTPQAALSRQAPLTRHGGKGVFVFPWNDGASPSIDAALFGMHQRLCEKFPTLAVIGDKRTLEAAPRGGSYILCSPSYPEVSLVALRSASWVISADPFVTALVRGWDIPCYDLALESPAAIPAGENQIYQWLELERSHFAQPRPAVAKKGEAEFGICAVADSKFIGFFFGLVENLLQVCDVPWRIYLLALDEKAKELALKQYPNLPITVFLASEVWDPVEWKEFQHKPIADRAYASKPRALLAASRQMGSKPLFFSDVDIHFFQSPLELRREFGDHKLLFMPQWSDVFAWARFHGMFNSGLVGVLPGGEGFLNWWADMCVPFCRVEMEKGYFTDQVFLDMGLWHFPQIGVYRGMDHNVAPWNRKTLGVHRTTRASAGMQLKDGRAVKSFHAAGPDSSGYFELKFAWDQVVSFFSVLENPDSLSPLYKNTLDQQLVHWPALREAIEVRANWARRLRKKASATTPKDIEALLSSSGKATTSWLRKLENVAQSLIGLIRQGHPSDNVSSEEQKLLVGIQQKFAFANPEQTLHTASRTR